MQSNKALSLFSLVMINVVAIDNLKSLPFGAKFGLSLVFYYVLAALFFFIPVLVAAECNWLAKQRRHVCLGGEAPVTGGPFL